MSKKRRTFDINFNLDDDEEGFPAGNAAAPEIKSHRSIQGHPLQNVDDSPVRRGPMASAIAETSAATEKRLEAEAAIRAENDALAHEHVRLKKLGLIADLVQTSEVRATKLIRDRAQGGDDDLQELMDSIVANGLSNPIRVEQCADGYELIQGHRRLSAFRALERETGDPRYARIPATLVPRGEALDALYRKMVDENLVRKDISFGEMAQLALSYAADAGVTVHDAVSLLYASANKQKRSYIRAFARLLEQLEGAVRHPDQIPRALGLQLEKVVSGDAVVGRQVVEALAQVSADDRAGELAVLQAAAEPKSTAAPRKPRSVSKTTLLLQRPEGAARLTAHDGKVELRLDRDFSAFSKADLQAATEAFFAALDGASGD